MMKAIFFFVFLYAFVGNTKAQVASFKKFSVLSADNRLKSGVTGFTANIYFTITAAPSQTTTKANPEEEKNVKNKRAAKPNVVITKDPNIFMLDGVTSNVRLNTIAAKFGFAGSASDSANIVLYKAEIKDGKRFFSIMPGKTLCEKISIHFSTQSSGTGSENGIVNIVIPTVLQSGEYLFVDKASLSANAEQIKCYPFTIL